MKTYQPHPECMMQECMEEQGDYVLAVVAGEANALFFAAAREALPALLSENEELKRERDCRSGDPDVCHVYEKEGFPYYRHLQLRAEAAERQRDEAWHQFKVFHKNLCLRFGYCHDEEYWWRDLVSLEEFLATKTKQGDEALREAFREAIAIVEGTAVPKPFSATREARKPPKPSLTRIEVVNELRAACPDKGGDNG